MWGAQCCSECARCQRVATWTKKTAVGYCSCLILTPRIKILSVRMACGPCHGVTHWSDDSGPQRGMTQEGPHCHRIDFPGVLSGGTFGLERDFLEQDFMICKGGLEGKDGRSSPWPRRFS